MYDEFLEVTFEQLNVGVLGYVGVSMLGWFGNCCIVLATLQNKSLQSRCGFLVAFAAVGDLMHQGSHIFMIYLFFSRTYPTSLRTCVWVNVVPVFGLNLSMLMTFFVAVDRVLSIRFSLWYRTVDNSKYICVLFFVVFLVNGVVETAVVVNMLQRPEERALCLIIDVFPPLTSQLWFVLCLTLNVSALLCYLIVGCAIKSTKGPLQSNRRILKSLVIIALTLFLGCFLNALVQVIMRSLNVTPVRSWLVGFYCGVGVNLAISSNYIIFFCFSRDYRAAFLRQFAWLRGALPHVSFDFPMNGKRTSIVPQSANGLQSRR